MIFQDWKRFLEMEKGEALVQFLVGTGTYSKPTIHNQKKQ